MRTVLLVHQPTDGGVGRHVSDLAAGLQERGFRAVLCGPSRPAGLPDSCAHIELDLRRAIAPTGRCPSGSPAGANSRRDARRRSFHAHSSKAGAVVRLAKPLHPRTPVIYTPHGYAFAGHFSHEHERFAYRQIERMLAGLADRVLCVCESEARLASTVGPAQRVRVVHNGIEPARTDGPVDRRGRGARSGRPGSRACSRSCDRARGWRRYWTRCRGCSRTNPGRDVAIGGNGPDPRRCARRPVLWASAKR